MTEAQFTIYQDGEGEWRWALVHQNGRTLADGGQGYASKQKAEQGVEAVKRTAADAYVIERASEEHEETS